MNKILERIDLGLGIFNPKKLSKKKKKIMIDAFLETGSSNHSVNREILGWVMNHCEKEKIPYRLDCVPEMGYVIIDMRKFGYRIHWEERAGGLLTARYKPDKGEHMIPTEIQAWEEAQKLYESTDASIVNIYIVDHKYMPVKGYDTETLRRYNIGFGNYDGYRNEKYCEEWKKLIHGSK